MNRTPAGAALATKPVHYHPTIYGDGMMVAISDSDGTLVAVMNGPLASQHAHVFCDLPDLLEDLEAAMLLTLEDAQYGKDLIAAVGRLILLTRGLRAPQSIPS
jgi:hypothetical protein